MYRLRQRWTSVPRPEGPAGEQLLAGCGHVHTREAGCQLEVGADGREGLGDDEQDYDDAELWDGQGWPDGRGAVENVGVVVLMELSRRTVVSVRIFRLYLFRTR